MKRTKKISIQDYGSPFYFNKRSDIMNLVNKEALLSWSKSENPPLPKFNLRVERLKLTAGVFNMCRQFLP